MQTAGLGILFVAVVFFGLPRAFIALNGILGWPEFTSAPTQGLGWLLILAGSAALVVASRLFRRLGDGTPVPVDPPKRLVVDGLFRYSRNPIYVGDLVILLGIFLARGQLALLLYAGIFFVFLHLWLLHREEPVLQRRFGEEWTRYSVRVPRWIWQYGGRNRPGPLTEKEQP